MPDITTLFEWFRFTTLNERLRQVYGQDAHPNYLEEKRDLASNLPLWWAYLDNTHRRRMLQAAQNRG